MKTLISAAAMAVLIGLGAAPAVHAQTAPAAAPPRPNALAEFPAVGGKTLKVTTPGWADGADIPFEFTQYRTNIFPGLSWTKGPAGTKSYVLIMQDTDLVMRGAPILHWSMYNIPGDVTMLPQGMTPTGAPAGSSYGPNYRGKAQPFLGPRTPPGKGDHYHFQIFALDTVIPADPAITYDGIVGPMKGHVLASGEVVGVGHVDPNAPPRPAPPPPAVPPAAH